MPQPKTPEQIALRDLVNFLVDHEPRFGYDASNLTLTNEQAAIVIAADPDADDDIADACDNDTLVRLLRAWPGVDAKNVAIEVAAKTVVLALEGAKRSLLQLVIAESERREEHLRSLTPLDMEPNKYEFANR